MSDPGRGPFHFPTYPILDGPASDVSLIVDGYTIELGLWSGFNNSWIPDGNALRMADGTSVYQCPLPKPKQPRTMAPMQQTFPFTAYFKEDVLRLRETGNDPVLAFFGLPWTDQWDIRNGDAGQLTWRTSRRIGWNGTTRTHSTHPPEAYIKTGQTRVAQTIVTSGTPAAGEVKVPTAQTADIYYDSITTPALTAGDRLLFRYWPEMLCQIRVQDVFQAANVWELQCEVTELLAGEYD